MLLRLNARMFEVVGPCYVHGLADSEGLLGPLLNPWRAQIKPGINGVSMPCYFDMTTQALTLEDPRLDPLPEDWELLPYHRTPDDPLVLACFRSKVTGEKINSDPRLFSNVLKSRGTNLKAFQLV
jgi:hypothetical protein